MKIGILVTGHVNENLIDKHGQYPAMFEKLLAGNGFEFAHFEVVENRFPDSVGECDGWIVTGSRHGAYEDHPWINPLEDFIRAAYEKNIPIAGVCFGHQIMAQALGGRVEKFSGGWNLGQQSFQAKQGKKALLAIHQDQVVEKPEEAEVLLSNEFCANAALVYKNERAISFQPHPEFSPEFLRDLIGQLKGTSFSDEKGAIAIATIGEKNDSDDVTRQIVEFFRSTLIATPA